MIEIKISITKEIIDESKFLNGSFFLITLIKVDINFTEQSRLSHLFGKDDNKKRGS